MNFPLSGRIPKVSVVMAAYNAADYLHEAIESILGQTFVDFEFIIIDDCSSDETGEIIQGYRDERLVYIRNMTNSGQTIALNRGIREAARGEYIARVDADDIAEPDMLAEMVKFMNGHPDIGVVGTAKWMEDARGQVMRIFQPPTSNAEIQQTLLNWNCLPHGGAMYRAYPFRQINGYNEGVPFSQDYDIALRITEPWDAANLTRPLYHYRWHWSMQCIAQKDPVEEWCEHIKDRAMERRLAWGLAMIRRQVDHVPVWLLAKSRSWIAERYTWWSMSARKPGKPGKALQFLLIALAVQPNNHAAWEYIRGILKRKTRGIFC